MASEDLKARIAEMRGSINLSDIAPAAPTARGVVRTSAQVTPEVARQVGEVLIGVHGVNCSFFVKSCDHDTVYAAIAAATGVQEMGLTNTQLRTRMGSLLKTCKGVAFEYDGEEVELVNQPGKVGTNLPATWAYLSVENAKAWNDRKEATKQAVAAAIQADGSSD